MRVCVFGAGSTGGFLAARLARAGSDTSVIARGPHLEAIRRNGLTIRKTEDDFSMPVTATQYPADLGTQDVVFVTLKATALSSFAESAGPLLNSDTAVVFCQNGVPWWYAHGLSPSRPQPPDLSRLDPGGILARRVAPDQVVGGVVYSPNEITSPGVITNSNLNSDDILVGEATDAATPRITRVRSLLIAAGIGSPAVEDIRAAIWRKLITNLSESALALLVERETDVINDDSALLDVSRRLRREILAITAAHGVTWEERRQWPRHRSHHKASILQDYEARRQMEIEALFMAPIAFARAANVDIPVLQTVAAIAARRAIERGLYVP